ncbi:Pr6Pr family membrane protein [Streptomyces sp. AC495_CC817]|uniref:Pr6Pr family membrane protein n=1 Tax=Streptomyces sp. AC495_CC817 TaxID=2823900 RepID=UPI001C27E0FF|nr:Pr6Pr family membrane protein [Streptomyces sp. AC495_CC817]
MTTLRPAARLIAVKRALVGIVVIGILIHTYVNGIPARGANPFDYFGYFTNLTSLLTGGILVATGVVTLVAGSAPRMLHAVRGVAVACMIVVALVYNLVVPGTGSAPPWVSLTLHLVFPLLLVFDWLLVADRPALPWRRLWLVLPYPIVWLVVVLVRGATDGWVPYGFLLPERGIGALSATTAGLLVALLAAGALVWLMSRARFFAAR